MTDSVTPSDREAALKQLEIHMDIYKQHFDLFLKGIILFVGIVGAVGGYVFTSNLDSGLKTGLAVIIMIGSLVALRGCVVSRKWVDDLAECVGRLEERLGLERFPFSGAYGVLKVMTWVTVLFSATGLIFVFWFIFK